MKKRTIKAVVATVRDPSSGRFTPIEPERNPSLAPPQVAIIQYIANGKRNAEIALLMGTSEAAIWNQLVRIKDLTGCATSAALVSWALRRKLIV